MWPVVPPIRAPTGGGDGTLFKLARRAEADSHRSQVRHAGVCEVSNLICLRDWLPSGLIIAIRLRRGEHPAAPTFDVDREDMSWVVIRPAAHDGRPIR